MSNLIGRAQQFVAELKRRSVFQVASVYAVTAWGATIGAAELLPAFGAPAWAVPAFAAVAVLGFPIAVGLAWAFEVTPHDEAHAAGPDMHGASGATTALFGASGVVRVAWRDTFGVEQERLFDQPFALGRDMSCALRFDDALVSRRHAEVNHEHGVWYVADLGSRNGTLLDGQRITRALLPPRGVIRLSEGGPAVHIELRGIQSAATQLAGAKPA